METTTTTVEQKQGEPAVTTPEAKVDPFAILETEPIFATDDKPVKPTVDLNLTLTPQELADKKALEETTANEAKEQLTAKAKELGLPETATADDIKVAETKIADELKAKAVELGLPETATKEDIAIAELKKTESEGFVTESEVQTGLLGAEDGTWKALMLAKGYEVPADYKEESGFEIYSKLEETKHLADIEKAKTEAQESVLSTLRPDLRAAIELANAIPDATIEEILNPTIQIDNLLKLSDEELVKKEVEASNPEFTPEMVDIKIQEIKDANKVKVVSDMVRLTLNKNKTEIQNFHQQKIKDFQERQIQEKSAAEKGKIEQVIKALDRVPSFLDKNITQTDRQFLANKINSGAVNDLLNNPEKLAKAITMLEFYDKGITSYENRVREKLLVEQKKTLHNTPQDTTTAANQVVVQKPITNQFDILKVDFGEK